MNDIYKQLLSLPPEKRELFKLILKEKGIDIAELGIIPQDRKTNKFPLSFGQQRLWFLDQLEPGSPLYNNPAAVVLTGPLNVTALKQSLEEVTRRHEVLRTTFTTENEQPVQVIHPSIPLSFEERDLQHLPETEREPEALHLAVAEARQPFDLNQGPLLRTVLVKMSDTVHWVLLTMHHVVSDAWSLGILVQEVAALYAAFSKDDSSPLPELTVQYADFAVWQREWLQGELFQQQLDYWSKQLADCPAALNLPTDRPRPAYQSYQGKIKFFDIPQPLAGAINKICQQKDVTPFMFFMAALQTLLHKYTGQEDLCVGTPIAGRNRAETESLIGFFINTLVVRGNLTGNPRFSALLQQMKTVALEAYAHQDLPFEMLVEKLQPERDMSRSPFFQVMFVHQNAPIQPLKLPEITFRFQPIDSETAKFDLTLVIEELPEGLKGHFIYNTDLFDAGTILRMIQHFRLLLEKVVNAPEARLSDYALITEIEQRQVFQEWCDVVPYVPPIKEKLLIELFESRVAKSPESVAVVLGERQLTYQELNQRANQLAHFLRKSGVGPEVLVGLCVERSPEMIVGLLGILKAGGAFLPLDPDYPAERLTYMISDAQLALIVTQQSLLKQLPEQNISTVCFERDQEQLQAESLENPAALASHDNVAYVIYTSGSTGKPKGVMICHGAFVNHCVNMQKHFQLDANDRVLQFASINFDASLEQIFPTLLAGACLVLRGPDIWSAAEFHEKLVRHRLSVVNPPTAYWHQLVQEWIASHLQITEELRLMIVGGDAMREESVKLWSQIASSSIPLLNAYGPTETTITSTTQEIFLQINKNGGINTTIPIGKPLPHRVIYILDKMGFPTPVGVAGELCIGGICLARGYLKRPDLTAERFVPDPFGKIQGARLYRTGDLVRFLPDGSIEFIGRVDHQVKIRGFRVELGEIESILKQHPSIQEAVVTIKSEPTGDKRVVAYLLADTATEALPAGAELRNFLSQQLPDYMLPAVFMFLDAFPRTPIGKIDRLALPEPEIDRTALESNYVAPTNPVEEIIAEIWAKALNVEKVGIHDNFFALGGHSLMATQIIARVREQFQVDIPLKRIFEAPTIANLALIIAESQAEQTDEQILDEMLNEIEDLSEEEVARLLQAETS